MLARVVMGEGGSGGAGVVTRGEGLGGGLGGVLRRLGALCILYMYVY